ncbi:hypothetical protein Droror1_Dr00004832 [Drosera rotundifolia]
MWTAPHTQPTPLLLHLTRPNPPPPQPPLCRPFLAPPRRRYQAAPGDDAGDLSRALLILQAFQRATAEKTKGKKTQKGDGKKKGGVRGVIGDEGKDGKGKGEVRPLMVKKDWGDRLVELEKRLRGFMEA